MYKLRLFIVLLAVLFASCRSHEKAKPSKKQPETPNAAHAIDPLREDFPVGNVHLLEFKSFLKSLDLSIADNATVAAKKYGELFKNDDVKVRDTAFVIFNQFHVRLCLRVDELHQNDTTIQYDSLLTDSNGVHSSKITAKTAEYDKMIKANGMRVASSEGIAYIEQDLAFEVKWFKEQLSEPFQKYLTQTADEQVGFWGDEGGFITTPKKLAEHTIWWENFITRNPNLLVSKDAKSRWQLGIDYLLTGLNSYPRLDYDTAAYKEYTAAYSFVQNTSPNSKTNRLINPYFKLVAKKDSSGARQLLDSYLKQGVVQSHEDED